MNKEVLVCRLNNVEALLTKPSHSGENTQLRILNLLILLRPELDEEMGESDSSSSPSDSRTTVHDSFLSCIRLEEHVGEYFEHLGEGL